MIGARATMAGFMLMIVVVSCQLVASASALGRHSELPSVARSAAHVRAFELGNEDRSSLGRLIGVERLAQQNRWLSPEQADEEQSTGNGREEERQQQQQQLNQKLILKKRWHKLVDDLLDEELATGEEAKRLVSKSTSKSEKSQKASAYNKKKWLAPSVDSETGEKIMIIMKKPLKFDLQQDEEEAPAPSPQPPNVAQLDTRELPPVRRIGSDEHHRRILDDKFGIRKESIFTTNNHLGLKEAPKFGSDDEY